MKHYGTVRPVFERLPAFYRETPGLLELLTAVADDLVSLFQSRMRREGERIIRKRATGRAKRRSTDGTVEQVVAWLEARHGVLPRVWTGLQAFPQEAGSLVLRKSYAPAAVLALSKEEVSTPPPDFDIPGALLPVGVKVQAILTGRWSGNKQPLAGERISGEIFWMRAKAF